VADREPILDDPAQWKIEPLSEEPTISIQHHEHVWYFILAPESEGLLASFQRLQSIRSWVSEEGELPLQYFGVVSPNTELLRLAETQGYMTFPSALAGQ
jgi:hypothetical protein